MPTPPQSYSAAAAEKLRLALRALAATAVAGCTSHHEPPSSSERTAGVIVCLPRETEVAPAVPSRTRPTKAGEYIVYDVEPGDTLSDIARRYGVSVKSLKELNNLSEPDRLRVKQSLFIPMEKDSSATNAAPREAGSVPEALTSGPAPIILPVFRTSGRLLPEP